MTGCSDSSAVPTAGNIIYNFQRKCCEGLPAILIEPLQCQQNASVLATKQNGSCLPPTFIPPLTRVTSLIATSFSFPEMNLDLKVRRFTDMTKVQYVTAFLLKVLDNVSSSGSGTGIWDRCIQSWGGVL